MLTKLSHVLEPGYRMMGVYSFHQIEELLIQKPDLILTTVPLLQKIDIPVIPISNILGEEDIFVLREDLDKYHRGEKSLVHLMKKNLFFNDVDIDNKEELLHYLTNKMIDAGYITHNIKDSIFLRESIASTAIGNKVAIPHPINIEVSKSCICTAILNNEMDWDKDERVVIVFIIVLENKWAPYFQEIFSELYSLTSSYDSIADLRTKNNFDEFIKDITAKLG
ncbi:PTS sugar transporter subunit IIA [Clostridium sp. 1xD42-85]|uniref:PTS sugar transporter subunit IIA n=2 Tax=Clostridia TaxID=186801 RepID=UPI0016005964|nr:PTS sugar transporter subunit IIA [Clostridium sp. 1xD42-85]